MKTYKTMRIARAAGCLFGAAWMTCAADDAAAVTANWKPTAAGAYSLTDLANWDVDRVPTNAADTVHFAPDVAALTGTQYIDFPVSYKSNPWTLGTIDGATNQVLRLAARPGVQGSLQPVVRFADPNGFLGTYTARDYKSTWAVTATESFTPYLAQVTTLASPLVQVDGAGTAKIGRVFDGGRLEKSGTGDLEIEEIDALDRLRTRLRANGGTVTFGYEEVATTPPVADPALWLDASRAETLTTDEEADEDGRRHVRAWRDAGGGAIVATPFAASVAAAPFLGTDADGSPYVDFGAYSYLGDNDANAARVALYGPSASLKFSATVAGVREVFVVWADWTSRETSVFVTGSTGSYELHRMMNGGMGLLDGIYASLHSASDSWADETWIDGVKRSWNYSPYDFSARTVASVNLNGNGASVNTLANDRTTIRAGGCRIYEVVLYTRELTSAERQAMNAYLMAKWKEPGLAEFDVTGTTAQTIRVPDGKRLDLGTLTVPANGTLTKTGAGALNVADVTEAKTSVRVAEGRVTFNGARSPDGMAPAEAPLLWLDATKAESLIAQTVEGDETGRAFIGEWKDWRDLTATGAVVAASAAGQGRYPFVVENVANGHPAVDFGMGWYCEWGTRLSDGASEPTAVTNDSSYMTFPLHGRMRQTREAFTVVRMKMPNGVPTKTNRSAFNPGIFSSDDGHTFARYGSSRLLAMYAPESTAGARWMVDGGCGSGILRS